MLEHGDSAHEELEDTSSAAEIEQDKPRRYRLISRIALASKLSDARESDRFLHPKLRSQRNVGAVEWRPEGISKRPEIHPGRLCEFCDNLNLRDLLAGGESDWGKVEENQGHQRTPQRLEESAIRCPLCRLFYRELSSGWKKLLQSSSPEPVAPHWGQTRFKVWIWNGNLENEWSGQDKGLRYLVLEWHGGGVDAFAEVLLTAKRGEWTSASHSLTL